MKYSKNFERDYDWYLKYKDTFKFDGSKNKELVEDLINGKSAKECFYIYDTTGELCLTKEVVLLNEIFKCKGSINFQIKEWAISRADATLPKILFKDIIKEFELLDWMIDAVEHQKYKHYNKVKVF